MNPVFYFGTNVPFLVKKILQTFCLHLKKETPFWNDCSKIRIKK